MNFCVFGFYFGGSVLAGSAWFYLVSWVVDHSGRRKRQPQFDLDNGYTSDARERARLDFVTRFNGRPHA
jgi:hypothetical protein